jgi:fucose permease
MIMKREYTSAELGMMYGLTIGAVVASLLMALTGDAWWLSFTGAGIALGYGLGAARDKRAG